MRFIASLVGLALMFAPANAARAQGLISSWVQMAPGGLAEARIVVDAQTCPMADVDGRAVPMRTRAAPDEKFPILLCAFTITPAMKKVSVMGRELKLPAAVPQRILVLGDTGCRIEGRTVQACDDPSAWPFPEVAERATSLQPDLVIDVGDYLYRESACPAHDARCAGSPSGDNWASWSADFFTPGKPLLDAAPWVIVRGNHEECARSGKGFLRLLGPLPFVEDAPCTEHVAPYAVPLGGPDLVVMDNSNAVDRGTSSALVRTYEADFEALSKFSTTPVWIAMHHPIWGVVKLRFDMVLGGNSTLMEAEDAIGMPSNVDLMLGGHIHTFEAIDYNRNLPPQLIVGEGGDLLNNAPRDFSGLTVGTVKVDEGRSLPGYGFLLLTREKDEAWKIDVYNSAGVVALSCTFANRRIDCPKD